VGQDFILRRFSTRQKRLRRLKIGVPVEKRPTFLAKSDTICDQASTK
jgi:hypothetical protein